MYNFNKDGNLTKDENVFFKNPLGHYGEIYLGLEVPKLDPKEYGSCWYTQRAGVILAGGMCCHGFIMSVSQQARIEKVLELDINVAAIVPLVHESGRLSLLVTGQGCDGSGMRHVEFEMDPFPHVTQIIAGEEAHKLLLRWPWADCPNWFNVHPLDIPEVWDLLSKHGLKIDREKTEEIQEKFPSFGRKLAQRGWYPEWKKRAARLGYI